MAKVVDNSLSIKLFNLCNEIYKSEQYLKTDNNDLNRMCYLIDVKSIEGLKKKLKYDKLEKCFANNISLQEFKEKIKDHKAKLNINILPEKFNNSHELMQALDNNKKYYLITNISFFKKINADKNFDNFGIKVIFKKDKMKFIFNDNGELSFFKKETGIIEKSLLIFPTNQKEPMNSSGVSIEKQPSNNFWFKDDLEILIRLFYYNKFLKEKENKDFNRLNQENYRSAYLINYIWLEKYKSFFEYNDLENYLLQIGKKDSSYVKDNDYISSEYIENLISNLPLGLINKLQKKKN